MTYFMFVLLRPRNKWRGQKKIKSRSFHQYSWNSEVDTSWISLIGWPHKTSLHNWNDSNRNELAWYLHIVEQTYFSKVRYSEKGLLRLYLNFTMKLWVWFVGHRIKFFLNEAEKWASDVVQTISWKKQRPQIANISMKSRAKIKGPSPRPFPRILIRCKWC